MSNKTAFFILYGFLFIICASLVIAPPSPHGVRGIIYHSDGVTQVPTGIPVNVTDTNNSNSRLTRTSGPPSQTGGYSTTLTGNDGDLIIVKAWNLTHYGNSTAILVSGTTRIDVILNKTRPAEPNVTITRPTNNAVYNVSSLFNLTANITMYGSSGENCNATLSIIGNSVNITQTEQFLHNIGSIQTGTTINTTWNLTGIWESSSNVTVNVQCSNMGERFDQTTPTATAYNLTIFDVDYPTITIIGPSNNSVNYSTWITFRYWVNDSTAIAKCSLILEGIVNITNTSINKNVNQTFNVNLSYGIHNWSINCTDISVFSHNSSTGTYRINVTQNSAPTVRPLVVTSPINLAAGTTTQISCNATITDVDGISELTNLNATFYDEIASYPDDQNDPNDHYSNTSCRLLASNTLQANYTCTFIIWYYANNQSWKCNISAMDSYNNTGTNTTTTTINELYSFDVNDTINYGSLTSGATSPNDVNITLVNSGNKAINISLWGYANIQGDNLSMNCTIGNITVGNTRYSTTYDLAYGSMYELNSSPTRIPNFQIPKRINELSKNETYWKIQVPFARKGNCRGYVIFSIEV